MDNYYDKRDAKVNIAKRLMALGDWEVFGFSEDKSDWSTDYYCPAHWGGVAIKNGYKFVVDCSKEEEEYVSKVLVSVARGSTPVDVQKKIEKLQRMTVARGATPSEEATAKAKIEILLQKKEEKSGAVYKEVKFPGHMANPRRCNWHIEKDGIIIDKGNGIIKFSKVPDINSPTVQNEWQEFNNLTKEQWICKKAQSELRVSPWISRESAWEMAQASYECTADKFKILEDFNKFIARVNNTCGGMMGDESEFYTYQEKEVEEEKVELKVFERPGEVKIGQCFILKSDFNLGYKRGYVYRIKEQYGDWFVAYRLGKGYKKELTGKATYNSWGIDLKDDRFFNWINQGAIAWCELREVKTINKVKKMVKVKG